MDRITDCIGPGAAHGGNMSTGTFGALYFRRNESPGLAKVRDARRIRKSVRSRSGPIMLLLHICRLHETGRPERDDIRFDSPHCNTYQQSMLALGRLSRFGSTSPFTRKDKKRGREREREELFRDGMLRMPEMITDNPLTPTTPGASGSNQGRLTNTTTAQTT